MPVKKAVIPAAGLGTRLYPITKSQPKEMLPLGRKPAIQVVVEEVIAAGITDICIVTGKDKRGIEDHFDAGLNMQAPPDGDLFPHALRDGTAHIFYVRQPEPKGLGDALIHAEAFVRDEGFLVALGDAVIAGTAERGDLSKRMDAVMEATQGDAVVAVRKVARTQVSDYGIVDPMGEIAGQSHFAVADLVEKPAVDEAPSSIAIAGRYLLGPIIFDYLKETPPGAGGEVQLTDALRRMTLDREAVWAVLMGPGEQRYDVGNFLQYSRAFIRFSLDDAEVGVAVREYIERIIAD